MYLSGGIDDILALGDESKKCKPKSKSADSSGSGDEEVFHPFILYIISGISHYRRSSSVINYILWS